MCIFITEYQVKERKKRKQNKNEMVIILLKL